MLIFLIFNSFAVKYRGRDDIITDRVIDRAADQVRTVEAESSQIRVGRVVPTGLHQKQLAEQCPFGAPCTTRRRHVRSIEKSKDGVVVGEVAREVDQEVVREVAEKVVGDVTGEVVGAEEIVRVVVDELVQPNVVVANLIPSITADTNLTTPSTVSSVHTDRGFLIGLVDRSMLTEYADHVVLRLWQGDVYVFYV